MRPPRARVTLLSLMDVGVARSIAHSRHGAQRDRFDEPVVEHVERVARSVPVEARAVALLHDVLEHTATTEDELRDQGLTDDELGALRLLTRSDDETFELHALRIAWAPGLAGVLARSVKVADLDDHLHHPSMPSGAPPYAWARRHITGAGERGPVDSKAA
jgi:guanosine-3',5'-bis(diphosphate) 3'-pyrophosphohydrolase